MKILTVFTPTFNRAYCLHLGYEALKRQTSSDFKWLIIDDGSTDNTKELVDNWIAEGVVEIEYYYKKNGGMHTGHNEAYKFIDTELNVCIDSDDWMPIDAVEKIITLWKKFGDNKYAGLAGLDANSSNIIIGIPFPDGLKECTYSELQPRYGVWGDKKSVYRTDVIKRYAPYPIFGGEKFVPLYLPIIIDKDFKVLCFNEILCNVDYMADGSTLNMFGQYINNPNGFIHYRKILMKYVPFYRVKFRHSIHYISSCLMIRKWNFIKESPQKFLTFLAIPFGVILYFYITYKKIIWKKRK